VKIRADHDGYPVEEDVEALRNWSGPAEEVPVVLDAVGEYLTECGYGSVKKYPNDGLEWQFATGGWSGCEEVIGAIPLLVHSLAWQSSHRGGLHVYGLEVKRG